MKLPEIMDFIINSLKKGGIVEYTKRSDNGRIARVALLSGTVFNISIAVVSKPKKDRADSDI